MSGIKFPVYRKYPNEKGFFRILAPDVFEEIKVTGKQMDYFRVEAKQLPERNLIQDMLNMEGGHWTEATPGEWFGHFERAVQGMN